MNRILSLLLCFVFLNAQVFAMSGGPGGGGTGQLNLVGTFAGVMIPVVDPTAAPGTALLSLDVNSIGLFGINVEQTDLATGVCAIFNKGEIFTGKMSGVADPRGSITMVLEARTIRLITATGGSGLVLGGGFVGSNVVAVGRLDAKVKSTTPGISSRISGTAVVNSFDDTNRDPVTGVPILTGFVNFKINGFKQSDTPGDFDDIDLGVDINRGGV